MPTFAFFWTFSYVVHKASVPLRLRNWCKRYHTAELQVQVLLFSGKKKKKGAWISEKTQKINKIQAVKKKHTIIKHCVSSSKSNTNKRLTGQTHRRSPLHPSYTWKKRALLTMRLPCWRTDTPRCVKSTALKMEQEKKEEEKKDNGQAFDTATSQYSTGPEARSYIRNARACKKIRLEIIFT